MIVHILGDEVRIAHDAFRVDGDAHGNRRRLIRFHLRLESADGLGRDEVLFAPGYHPAECAFQGRRVRLLHSRRDSRQFQIARWERRPVFQFRRRRKRELRRLGHFEIIAAPRTR